jgi:hypothetical protein
VLKAEFADMRNSTQAENGVRENKHRTRYGRKLTFAGDDGGIVAQGAAVAECLKRPRKARTNAFADEPDSRRTSAASRSSPNSSF